MRDELIKEIRTIYSPLSICNVKDNIGLDIPRIQTGSMCLDSIICGGIPYGRFTEIYGGDGTGKTTLCLEIIAQAQKAGVECLFLDTEQALNIEYAAGIVNIDDLLLSFPENAEEALGVAEIVCRESETVKVIVIDSVAGLLPRHEQEAEFGKIKPGGAAKLMNSFLRKTAFLIRNKGIAVILVNQERDKISMFFPVRGLNTTGGRGIKYYTSMRICLRRGDYIGNKKEPIGHYVNTTIKKSKVSIPLRTTEFPILYGEGISKELDILNMARQLEVVTKRGAYYIYTDNVIAQGEAKALIALRNDTGLLESISIECLEVLNG